MISRRAMLASTVGLAACGRRDAITGCGSLAGKTIRWVVPYPPGGSYDVYSRMLEVLLEQELGAEILVSNEAGGGGLVGSTRIRDAARDGLTLGVVNAAGLFSGMVISKKPVPNPARDFTVLGRISKSQSVLVTGRKSGLTSIDGMVERQRSRPLIVAASGVAGNTLFSSAVSASLLGLRVEYVAGYGGSREEILAAMRGEVDLMSANYDTLQNSIESGDLVPLMQVASAPVSNLASMQKCPQLGGPNGEAVRRAAASGRTAEQAQADAEAVLDVSASGVLVTGPAGLPAELAQCLGQALSRAVASQKFQDAARAARRTYEFLDAPACVQLMPKSERAIERLRPILEEAVKGMNR